MPLLDDDVKTSDAPLMHPPPQVVHAPMVPTQKMSMQSMGFMEEDPLINVNTSLA